MLTDDGGIIDDLMVTRRSQSDENGRLYLVVNASRKEVDYAQISSHLPESVKLVPAAELALIALQGPAASARGGGPLAASRGLQVHDGLRLLVSAASVAT